MDKSAGFFANKKTIAYILIVLAIIAVVIGLLSQMNVAWILIGAAFLVVGIVFYRRAKKQQA